MKKSAPDRLRVYNSYFFTDTGRHPWSPIAWYAKFIHSRTFAHNSIVIFQSILSSIAMYFLLKRVTPKLNLIVCALIAPLVVFTFNIDAVHYGSTNSVSLIVIPLILICIYYVLITIVLNLLCLLK